jgi:hypothetical protein
MLVFSFRPKPNLASMISHPSEVFDILFLQLGSPQFIVCPRDHILVFGLRIYNRGASVRMSGFVIEYHCFPTLTSTAYYNVSPTLGSWRVKHFGDGEAKPAGVYPRERSVGTWIQSI